MKKWLSILLVGVGGYGAKYVEYLLRERENYSVQIVGVVDPQAKKSKFYDILADMKIPIYDDLKDFYKYHKADLAIISSPIHYHCDQTCLALEHGSNVLCEKPAAATVQEVKKMIEYRDRFEKIVAIGFQWVYDPTFLKLKQDILAGKFGRPIRLKTMVLWPRDITYYTRSSWAGRIKINGKWVLDSVANNATAHFLHSMLFILGDDLPNTVFPQTIQAELYRANKIESFDTCCMRIWAKNIEILFYATHASKEKIGPYFVYEFEKARIIFNDPRVGENKLVAVYNDGETQFYGVIDHGSMKKLWDIIRAVRGEKNINCSLESALAHTLVINGAHESSKIVDFPEKIIKREQEIVWVENLTDVIKESFENNRLFSETKVQWSYSGKTIDLNNYEGIRNESI
ncbi:Gfo/Idh/MocA family protein [Thermotoga profunda]|uniref:Gfo/Idh/MocA family protein n=1 Tax=Thermotoga profunda TaxID=1508420 RepID=UPI000596C57D|nr:Gfo/Idh/MocA family oxidoreductase [Thermotoga profunda]